MAATKVTTKVIADDAVTIDKINDSALVTESEGISSNDNDTTVPTSAAVKDYVDNEVSGLVDAAPATLDTLNELAAALGDDANFSTTVTNSIATKQNELTASTGIDITSDVISITDTAVTAGTYGDANNTPQITVDAQGRLTSVTTVTTAGSGSGGGGTLDIEQDTFNGDGTTGPFNLTSSADSKNNLQVYIDGVYQSKDNFSVSGTSLTFTTAPNTGTDNIEVIHLKSVVGSVKLDSFTGDGSDTTFDLANTIAGENNTQVFIDGVYQSKDNYSTSGTTVTFSTAPPNGSSVEVVHIVPDSAGGGGIDWETTVQTSAFTATAGAGYFVNTTSAAITVTLPSSPSAGDEVSIVDYAGTADTNKITITSSDNINGASDDVKINYERGGVSIVYVDATQGWIAYNAANETATALIEDFPDIEFLVVAGGGGGGAGNQGSGGGGGAGGYRSDTITLQTSTDYNVSVGSGGNGGNNARGTSGGDSTFNNITSAGGGGGGYADDTGNDPLPGGSGGGAGRKRFSGTGQGGAGNTPATTPSQGNDGGDTLTDYGVGSWAGAGGGGSSQAGGNSQADIAGNGGSGTSNSITGTALFYAAGGGGGVWNSNDTAGTGGSSIGGNGGLGTNDGSNATINRGSGGGGAGQDADGGSGSSGVVIIKYLNSYTISETTSPNVLTFTTDSSSVSGYNITTFTAGENGTIEFTAV
jgi:hypothetical protein